MTEPRDPSLIDRIRGSIGGTGNRPAGPDYAADEEVLPGEFGAGLDGEEMTGTGEHDTGTGLAYDFERREVTEPVDPDPDRP